MSLLNDKSSFPLLFFFKVKKTTPLCKSSGCSHLLFDRISLCRGVQSVSAIVCESKWLRQGGGLSILLHNKQFVSQEHPSCSCCWLHHRSLGNVLASIVWEVEGHRMLLKAQKEEVRGWIVRPDKELDPPLILCLHSLKNKTLDSFFSLSCHHSSFSHYQEIQEMKSGECSSSLFRSGCL